MAGRVAGKRAVITGAAQGLGFAFAAMLLKEGAQVTLTDINGAGVAAAAEGLAQTYPGRVFHFAHDVTSPDQWQQVLTDASTAMGGLNILINNAGIGTQGTVEQTPFDSWKHVLAVDLDSVFLGCKYALPLIRASGVPGSIVNISSIAGLIASYNYASYNAAKAGVWLLSKSVALDGARMTPQVRCNSVHPVFIDTPILDPLREAIGAEAANAKLARQVPLGRLGEPDDAAYLVLYLASDESKFVTGAEFKVDGGISAM